MHTPLLTPHIPVLGATPGSGVASALLPGTHQPASGAAACTAHHAVRRGLVGAAIGLRSTPSHSSLVLAASDDPIVAGSVVLVIGSPAYWWDRMDSTGQHDAATTGSLAAIGAAQCISGNRKGVNPMPTATPRTVHAIERVMDLRCVLHELVMRDGVIDERERAALAAADALSLTLEEVDLDRRQAIAVLSGVDEPAYQQRQRAAITERWAEIAAPQAA